MKGYKAFDKDFRCRGFQYEVGKTYKHNGETVVCKSGFHFCKYPFDVLEYYPLIGSRFAFVEAGEGVKTEGNKSVASELTVEKELSISDLIKDQIEIVGREASSGDGSKLSSSGDLSQLASSGYGSQLDASGDMSIIAAIGPESRAKGADGTWITLAEYKTDDEGKLVPICVKTERVGINGIKPDTWYQLKGGKFIEVI